MPISSTFTKTDFTMGGMDNLNYADRSSFSGTQGSNYSASVLFQDATLTKPLQKPPVSATGLNRSQPRLRTTLKCQEVAVYNKPLIRPSLPDDMLLYPENSNIDSLFLIWLQLARKPLREFVIGLLRVGLAPAQPQTPIWAATHILTH